MDVSSLQDAEGYPYYGPNGMVAAEARAHGSAAIMQ